MRLMGELAENEWTYKQNSEQHEDEATESNMNTETFFLCFLSDVSDDVESAAER